MWKRKGDERKQTLDTKIYFVVWLGTKPLLLYVVEALTKSIASWQSSLFWGYRVTTVTLIPISTKELHQEGWESLRLPHKDVDAAPHQIGGSLTCRQATNAPRGRRTEIQWFTLTLKS